MWPSRPTESPTEPPQRSVASHGEIYELKRTRPAQHAFRTSLMNTFPHNDGSSARSHADCWAFLSKRDRDERSARTRCGEVRMKGLRPAGTSLENVRKASLLNYLDRRGVRACLPPS